MGGDTKSPVWNLRITMSDRLPKSSIMKKLAAWDIAKLACWETAESQHTHVALVGNPLTPLVRSTVVRYIKSHFMDISGNANYSLSLPKSGQDINGLYRYICKGLGPRWTPDGPEIIENKNSLDIKQYHSEFWSNQEAFKEEVKALASKKQKDGIKEKYKIISELSVQYKGTTMTPKHVLDITGAVIAAYKGNVNDNTLFTCVQAISHECDPQTTQAMAGQRMLRKIFPQY